MVGATLLTLLAADPLAGFSSAAEVLSLRADVRLTLEVMKGEVHLRPAQDAAGFAKALRAQQSQLCPKVEVVRGAVVLRCVTRRLHAQVTAAREGNAARLELRELRGLPAGTGEEASVFFAVHPFTLGQTDECPGQVPLSMAECALASGERDEAQRLFLPLAKAEPWAALRLGDFAWARQDFAAALGHYTRAVDSAGLTARIATARLCELTGGCLGTPKESRVFDARGLREPLQTELELRALRKDALLGRPIAEAMVRRVTEAGRPSLCARAQGLCQALFVYALTSADEVERAQALSIALTAGVSDRGPLRVELARATASAADQLGAPAFAGAVLSAATPAVDEADLEEHLFTTARYFHAARDRVRANVIADYAAARLGAKALPAHWKRFRTEPPPHAKDAPAELPQVREDAAADLARALLARSRARTVLTADQPQGETP